MMIILMPEALLPPLALPANRDSSSTTRCSSLSTVLFSVSMTSSDVGAILPERGVQGKA
jgi:hypothetical protein